MNAAPLKNITGKREITKTFYVSGRLVQRSVKS